MASASTPSANEQAKDLIQVHTVNRKFVLVGGSVCANPTYYLFSLRSHAVRSLLSRDLELQTIDPEIELSHW